jgi:hypothetical protein
MRPTIFKVYRVFRALDGYSDEECRAVMRRASVNGGAMLVLAPFLAGAAVGGLLALAIVLGSAGEMWAALGVLGDSPGLHTLVSVYGTVLAVVLVTVGVREMTYLIAVGREVRRMGCRACGQSLMGLPLELVGDTPDPDRTFVRCAECGKRASLLELGLTRRDLIAPENGSPSEVGKVRMASTWGGKHYRVGERGE